MLARCGRIREPNVGVAPAADDGGAGAQLVTHALDLDGRHPRHGALDLGGIDLHDAGGERVVAPQFDVGLAEQLIALTLRVLGDDPDELALEGAAHAGESVGISARDAHDKAVRREHAVAIDDDRADVELALQARSDFDWLHA